MYAWVLERAQELERGVRILQQHAVRKMPVRPCPGDKCPIPPGATLDVGYCKRLTDSETCALRRPFAAGVLFLHIHVLISVGKGYHGDVWLEEQLLSFGSPN